MNINYSDELIRLLDEIETKIEYLENSSNLAFDLIEYDTIKTFHNYNLCFKNFKITFNHSSASQLLLFIKVVNTHFELSKRYEKLFRKQLSELLKILDIEHDCVITLSPVVFCEDRNSDVLDAYKRFCKHNTDERGKPLYDIVLDRDYHSEELDGKEVPVNFYRFRSDNLNKYLCDIFFSLYKSLLYMFDLVCAVCTYPSALISDEVLDKEELLCSLENELRQYAKEVGSNVERDLRKIAQNLKSSRSSPLTSEVWGKVMDEEDKLFDLAINGCLGETEEKQLEHISATKEQLIDNYSLLQKIKSTCLDEELFDIRLSVETHNLLLSLNADNLELFYELVLRRNIIQREMFPDKLKAQYEEWLNPSGNEDTQNQNESQKEINYFAPQKTLQEMLKQDCFNEVRKDRKYDEKWTDAFVEDLMKSEYGKTIAEDWALKGSRNKRNQIKGHVFGVLKDAGVLEGGYDTIAAKVVGKDEARTFGKYMGDGKNQPYAEWVKDYVAGVKE